MAQVLVRNLDDHVKRKLSERAARHGHSMEQEIRTVLAASVAQDRDEPVDGIPLGTRISRLFADMGYDLDIEPLRSETARPAVFED